MQWGTKHLLLGQSIFQCVRNVIQMYTERAWESPGRWYCPPRLTLPPSESCLLKTPLAPSECCGEVACSACDSATSNMPPVLHLISEPLFPVTFPFARSVRLISSFFTFFFLILYLLNKVLLSPMALMVSLPLFMLLCALFLLGTSHPHRLYFSYYVVQNANCVWFLCVFLVFLGKTQL